VDVLVTGGAGFIGSNIFDTLLAEGRSVRVLDDLSFADALARTVAWFDARSQPVAAG
jgi:nucleoside-diphosphate-sugar epimerase